MDANRASHEQDDDASEIDFATYAEIETVLSAGGGPLTLLLGEHEIYSPQDYASARDRFGRERAENAAVEGAFQRMREHFLDEYRERRRQEEALEREQVAEMLAAARMRAAAAPTPVHVEEPAPEPARPDLRGTALALDLPIRTELPFVSAPAGEPAAAAAPAAPERKPSPELRPRPALSGTSLALDTSSDPKLPFPVPQASTKATAPRARPPAALVETRAIGAGPMPIPVMPFQAGDGLANLPVTPPRESEPRKKPALSGTSLALDPPRGPAMPFSPAAPKITLTQHASMCAELACYPGREQDIFKRYGVDAAEKQALDEHYRAALAESQEARAAWNHVYQAYGQLLVQKR